MKYSSKEKEKEKESRLNNLCIFMFIISLVVFGISIYINSGKLTVNWHLIVIVVRFVSLIFMFFSWIFIKLTSVNKPNKSKFAINILIAVALFTFFGYLLGKPALDAFNDLNAAPKVIKIKTDKIEDFNISISKRKRGIQFIHKYYLQYEGEKYLLTLNMFSEIGKELSQYDENKNLITFEYYPNTKIVKSYFFEAEER